MLRRVLFSVLATVALAGAVGLAWLPLDLTPRIEAQSEPEPPSSEGKLLASEAAVFVSFKPADFLADELLKTIFEGLDKEMERSFNVPLADVQRVTLAVVPGGTVTLIHTRKAYDKDKLKTAFTEDRFGGGDKDKKDGGPRKVEILEKKAGTRTIYYSGRWERYVRGYCPIDKMTFAFGEVGGLETFFKGKSKASPEMSAAVALTGKHSLVVGFDGKRLAGVVKHERKERDQFHRRFIDKDKKISDVEEEKEEKPKDKAKDDKVEEADVDDLFGEFRGPEVIMMLPYRPLLKSKFGLLTLDVKKTYTLKASVTAQGKDDLEDLETAMKMAMYVLRDFPAVLRKQERGEMKFLEPLSGPVQKAFKAAKVERKDNVLSTTVTLTPEADLTKKVKEAMEEQKRFEKKERERFKDKDKGFDEKPREK